MYEAIGFVITVVLFVLFLKGAQAFLFGSSKIEKFRKDLEDATYREPRRPLEDAELSWAERDQAIQAERVAASRRRDRD